MRPLRAFLLLAALLLPTGVTLAQQPGFSFADSPPIALDVARIEVEVAYVPPMQDPHVDHVLAVTPTDAVRLWAQSRLKAVGSEGTATVIVRQASVVEKPLERTGGVRGWFTQDQSERYDGTLQVEVVAQHPGRGFQASASAAVSSSTSVAEDVTLAEREKTMLSLVQAMARELDSRMVPAIRNYFGPLIVPDGAS